MNVYVETYGCTANKSDAALIKGVLHRNGYNIVETVENADAIVVLTCTVIDTTEQRMLSRLKNLKKTGKKIVVSGCMASVQVDKVKTVLPDAQFLPPQYPYHIVEILDKKETTCFVEKNKTLFPRYYDDIIAPISIAEGCMFSCSYCITSLARGRLRSYPINEIKKTVQQALKQGCKEIQLTAQDTSSYGLDIRSNLGDLLNSICMINDDDFRIRVGMMNPCTCLKKLDSIIQGFNDSKIYKFLHLPVQSGDDEILSKMNRKYTVDDFHKIIQRFRERYPDVSISTDIIVGFPTETDEQFQHTIDLLKNVKPDIVNITRYSARPFTKAKTMKGRISTDVVKERSKKLTKLCNKISKKNNLKYINREYTVLITKRGKNNTIMGRMENYKPVVIPERNIELGSFINVKIIDATSTYLVGSII
ncbi:MAG: threonylcarbamoyladenosine tRNA methylthiotransferase [Thermoplasmata archaeon]|nr:MAG: threonylcarbamoyladenosine tRNA methylthiotransferase [Thermoplasmata archaeon]RLF37442.1 MAG: threonylcarbamoyladenosine tRNA methylthiotransferase [Thermoplasmata archaeon]RLF52318.1 MAG: threonylcarbamoyladenosine tRNA methylthiotransferase [Thermoplasmata archaeon]